MKRIMLLCLPLISFSALALPTDYHCALVDKENRKVLIESVVSANHRERKDNDSYVLIASNSIGEKLVIGLIDKNKHQYIVYAEVALNGLGYVNGDINQGLSAKNNPLFLTFLVPDTELSLRCDRGDDEFERKTF